MAPSKWPGLRELAFTTMCVYVVHVLSPLTKSAYAAALVKATPLVLLSLRQGTSTRSRLLQLGLLLSSLGDASLDLDHIYPTLFLIGLVCFAKAHLCYTAAFLQGLPISAWASTFAVPALAVLPGPAALLYYMWPHVQAKHPELALPVAVYTTLIAAMVVSSTAPRKSASERLWAVVGSVTFAVSDSILAVDKFVTPIANAKLLVMLTYYAAQLCIASCTEEGKEAGAAGKAGTRQDTGPVIGLSTSVRGSLPPHFRNMKVD